MIEILLNMSGVMITLMVFYEKVKSFSDYGLNLDNYNNNNITHEIDLMMYASELKK